MLLFCHGIIGSAIFLIVTWFLNWENMACQFNSNCSVFHIYFAIFSYKFRDLLTLIYFKTFGWVPDSFFSNFCWLEVDFSLPLATFVFENSCHAFAIDCDHWCMICPFFMFRLTKFKLHVDLQLKLVFLQFDLNLFCSSFICFILFWHTFLFPCCKNKCRNCMKRTRSSLTDLQRSRDWEAHHRSSQVLFVLFVVLCVLNFLFNYLVVSGDCLPACGKDQRFMSHFAVSVIFVRHLVATYFFC